MHKSHLFITLTSFITAYTMAMEDYQLDLAHIKTLQRQYIGKHGWTVKTGKNGKQFVSIDTGDELGELVEKIRITREFKEYPNTQFLLQQNNTNKSIISDGNDVHIINMQTGDIEETLFGHTDPVHCCAHTDYRNIIVTGSNDTTIKLWNTKNGNCLQTLQGHKQYVTHVVANRDTLYSTDWEPCLKVWDLTSGKCKRETPYVTKSLVDSHNKSHSPMSIMIHNNLLYIGATTGKITSVDPRTARALCDWNTHKATVTCLTPGKNNNLFYSGSWDQTIKQWDTRNMSTPTKILHEKNDPNLANYNIQNVYEDHSGTKIFSSDKNTIYVWDASKEQPKIMTTKNLSNNINPNCMHMNNNETELYVGTKEGIKTLTPTLNFEQLAALAEQK